MSYPTSHIVGTGADGNKPVTLYTNYSDPFAPAYYSTPEHWTFTTDYWNSSSIVPSSYDTMNVDQQYPVEVSFDPYNAIKRQPSILPAGGPNLSNTT